MLDSLHKADRLLKCCLGSRMGDEDHVIHEFSAFLLRWGTLDFEEKNRKYNKYCCHELHLYLFYKDRAYLVLLSHAGKASFSFPQVVVQCAGFVVSTFLDPRLLYSNVSVVEVRNIDK